MDAASTPEDRALDALVAQVADEFRERLKRGENPDVEEYAVRHPDAADELRDVLTALRLLEPAPADGPAIEVLGDFRLLREIGRGAMGIVYEAEQISLGRRVAVKVLPLAGMLDPRNLLRFQNEARAAASLQHANIVPVYAVGCERGVPFYAMQLIDGTTLDKVAPADPAEAVPRDAAFFRRVAEWGVQAADALEYAHGLRIVHRDVKPGNLMIDGQGKLWVTDFGLARLGATTGPTMPGDVLGTLRYMSPEQAQARHGVVDHRTDVYALGATLYELVAGRPAVAGSTREEVLKNLVDSDPVSPRKLVPGVPADLETIILKALGKEPGERYATAGELAQDLRRWLGNRPIQARPPSWWDRTWKWAGRHPRALLTAAATLLVIAVVATVAALLIADANGRTLGQMAEKDRALIAEKLALKEKEVAWAAADERRKNVEATLKQVLGSVKKLTQFGDAARAAKNLKEAEDCYSRACDELGMATATFPADFEYPIQLAKASRQFGDVLLALNKPGKAAAAYATAASGYERIAREWERFKGEGINGLADRCEALDALVEDIHPSWSEALLSCGRADEAEKVCRRSVELFTTWQQAFRKDRGKEDYLCGLGEAELALAQVLAERGKVQEADQFARQAQRHFGPVGESPNSIAIYNWANLAVLLGDLRRLSGADQEATGHYCQGRELLEYLVEKHPQHRWGRYALARLLTDCPEPTVRDPRVAVALATRLTEESQDDATFWVALGAARYRAAEWRPAVIALLRGNDLGHGGGADGWFYLALAQHALGEDKKAAGWSSKATEWTQSNRPGSDLLNRLRAEVAESRLAASVVPSPEQLQEAKDAFAKIGAIYSPVIDPETKESTPRFMMPTKTTDHELKGLPNPPFPFRLGLSNTQVTDAGLAELKKLDNLTGLHLSRTRVTDAGLKELKNLKHLSLLTLSKTGVTDAGLTELKDVRNLTRLLLDQKQATDAGLKELKSFINLTELSLAETQVTKEWVQDLQQALPNCRILPPR